ncbi:SDR family NAD(P)-dependent oxidoreductase [Actinomadura bangladeshensis]|jgi:3-oxoacyl-[acyl-carrier protein] reductase|uniref:SDR family oxidoreductase n=1 Tax=Actinomadura bangladeshensis TaxID=453573 RepID=A0A6L9QNV5_9ACTN|nr:SDR family NAD(P)-dependent oxidoreductase [Actinomadura bangladeshensis]NEA26722.1 SDR family oxidoreductase [Actinomadura bangladeshensis]
MYPELNGTVAVITGGSRGIGAATARAFAAEGAKVAVIGRDQEALDGVAKEVGGVGAAADVTDLAAVEAARRRIEDELGPAGVLCAFAGGGIARPGPTAAMTEEEWRSVVDGNLTATFLTLKAFLPGMQERKAGSIITMSSSAGRLPTNLPGGGGRELGNPWGAPVAYEAAKAGVQALTRHVAAEAGADGVRVNCVAPGTIRTERTARFMPPEVQEAVAAAHPIARLGEAGDVAAAALFLASSQSGWLTGLTLDIAGGRVML